MLKREEEEVRGEGRGARAVRGREAGLGEDTGERRGEAAGPDGAIYFTIKTGVQTSAEWDWGAPEGPPHTE